MQRFLKSDDNAAADVAQATPLGGLLFKAEGEQEAELQEEEVVFVVATEDAEVNCCCGLNIPNIAVG